MKWKQIANDQSLTIHISKEATISALVEELGLEDANNVHPPYRPGCPVDSFCRPPPPLQIKIRTRATPVSFCLSQLDRLWHAHSYSNNNKYVITAPALHHYIECGNIRLRSEVSQGMKIPWYYVHNTTIK